MGVTAHPLPPHSEQFDALISWISEDFPAPLAICDVGGGGHFLDFPARLRPMASRLVGVDPDAGVLARPEYDEAHQCLLEQWAPAATERFDVCTAAYVAEHVEDPVAFLRGARRLLRPGGALFGVTPNLWHYFGLVSAASTRLGVEDWLLHRVRDARLIEDYHFPVRYRLNSLRRIDRLGAAAGFSGSSFRCLDDPGAFRTYFPPRWRGLADGYSAVVNRLGRPALYGTILFRLDA